MMKTGWQGDSCHPVFCVGCHFKTNRIVQEQKDFKTVAPSG
ncbi:hypothetical protein [Ruminococcus callidus]|nr:hypothetical protein [Ruminococcus callidus]